jgi:hypothetical protein
MAKSLDDLKKDIDDLRKQITDLGGNGGVGSYAFTSIKDANTQIKLLEKLLNDLKNDVADLSSAFTKLNESIKSINTEFKKTGEAGNLVYLHSKNLSQVYNALLRDKRHLNNLGSSELKSLQQKLRYQKDDLNYLRENVLSGKILEHAKSRENLALKEKITNGEELTKKDVNRLKMMNNLLPVSERLTKEEMDQLENLGQQEEALKKANAQIEHRLKQEKEINKSLGGTKTMFNALNSIPFLGNIPGVNEALKETEAELKAAQIRGEALPKSAGTFKIAIGKLGPALKENLLNPLTISAFIFKQILAAVLSVDKAMVELQRTTGTSKSNLLAFQVSMEMSLKSAGKLNVPFSDVAKQVTAMNREMGIFSDILGNEALIEATEMVEKMGMTTKEGGKLAAYTRLTSDNVKGTLRATVDIVNNFNKQNKSTILGSEILRDIAETSSVIGARFKFNTIELAAAATQAKLLGLSMDEINGVASNLLNFEDSISAELEAELLTGRQINLEQERLLALHGKTGELAEKLRNNDEVRLAFQTDNVLIQEAQAKAMGMSLEQLSKIFYQQELNRLSAEQFKQEYGEQTYEQMKQLDIQQQFQKSIQALAESLTPIVGMFAAIFKHTSAIGAIMGAMAGIYVVKLVAGLRQMVATEAIALALSRKKSKTDIVDAGANVSSGMSKLGPIGVIAGMALAGAFIASLMGELGKADDMISPGYGERTLFGPEGAIALNNKDTVIAGTNLFDGSKGDDVVSAPKGAIKMNQQPSYQPQPSNVYISADGLLTQINARNNDVSNYSATKMA